MTQTAAVTSSGAGSFAGNSQVAGVSDLGIFGLLMGVVQGADVTADAQPAVMATLVNDSTLALTAATASQSFQLGEGPMVQVQGDTDAVAAFLAQVKQMYEQLVEGGLSLDKMSDSQELAGALTKMGMDPEVATMTASRISTMLDILEAQQGKIDEDTQGTLAAMMLAAIVPPQQPAATQADAAASVQVQISSITQTTVAKTFKHIQVLTTPAGAADVARDMMGLSGGEEGVVASAEGAQDMTDATLPLATPAKPEAKRELMVSVAPAAEASTVAVTVPPAAEVVARTVDVMAPAGGENVAAEKVIERAKGEVVYKWQADKSGNELLQAVQPQSASQDSSLNTQAQMAGATLATPAATAGAETEVTTFADRLAQAQHAALGHQVSVQMKPLADQGGGAVRMTLNPPELGQIQLELTVTEGKVHGTIAASQPAVVEQLARDLHSLRQGLADAGLKLGEQGINLMLSNNQSGNQQQGQHQGQADYQGQQGSSAGWNGGATSADMTEHAETILPGEWIAPERVVDVRA